MGPDGPSTIQISWLANSVCQSVAMGCGSRPITGR